MGKDPPDQNAGGGTLADVVRSQTPEVHQELMDSASDFCGKIKERFYYVSSRINRKMLVQTFNEKFKSLAYETYAFYESEGVKFIVLNVGFFENAPSFKDDFRNSSAVKHKNMVVHAVADDELVEGTFMRRPEKKILLEGLTPAQLSNRELLVQGFSGFLELHDNLKIKLLGDSKTGKFSGSAILRVKNFLKLPGKGFDFVLDDQGSYQRIKTTSYGFPRDLVRDFPGHKCFRCGDIGHIANACPTMPKKFSWKCTVCGSNYLGCMRWSR